MGKRGDKQASKYLPSVSGKPLSLREEKAGKKQANTTNFKSKLKLEHLQNLALWASTETSIPSLAAVFGHRLASANESLGLHPDPSLFACQRCETILQPSFNCTIRIEKNTRRRCKKPKASSRNRVVYKCHFCLHSNSKRGTPEGHMKEICPLKAKPSVEPECGTLPVEQSANMTKDTRSNVDEIVLPAIAKDAHILNSPMTPSAKTKITLEGRKRRRGKPGTKTSAESESNSAILDDRTVSASSKRRRRTSWTSLKEIAERSEDIDAGNANLTIPTIQLSKGT